MLNAEMLWSNCRININWGEQWYHIQAGLWARPIPGMYLCTAFILCPGRAFNVTSIPLCVLLRGAGSRVIPMYWFEHLYMLFPVLSGCQSSREIRFVMNLLVELYLGQCQLWQPIRPAQCGSVLSNRKRSLSSLVALARRTKTGNAGIPA